MDQVIEIERVSYPSPWQATHFLDELNSDFSFPLVVVDPEERVVAYICPHILLDEGHILNVAVHGSYRKRGIGRLLMQRVMDECRERCVATLYLEVRASNLAALSMYRDLGFVSTGVRRKYYENSEDAVLMEYNFPIERKRMQFKSSVLSNMEVSPGYFRMRLSAPSKFSEALPGQFVMVKVRDTIDPLLRRPFGVFDAGSMDSEYPGEAKREYFEMLYRVVGKGTDIMSDLHQGDHLDILGPIGKGFEVGTEGSEKILVGGGVGLAPLYYLAKEVVKHSPVRLFAGGRSKDDVICITEFERLGIETYVSTDDGTLGEEGLVTEVLERHLTRSAVGKTIFACGPSPMLKAVALIAERHEIPCQVSLEAYMACGVGACLGCVVKGAGHSDESPDYRCVCKDGPVFDSRDLLWE
jgi:dihydroorotate dehydrogenase electron transfer subunit